MGRQPDLTGEEVCIAQANIKYLRELCLEARQQDGSGGGGRHMSAVVPPSVAKPPSELPAGDWQRMVQRYNGQQVNGRDRRFPDYLLLRAEQLVVKGKWEHEHSKLYSPIPLGAVLQQRRFAANGELNPLSKRRTEQKVRVTADGEFHAKGRPGTRDP